MFLFFWVNLPKKMIETLRIGIVSSFQTTSGSPENKITKLQIENQKLRTQISHAYDWLQFDRKIGQEIDAFKEIKDTSFGKRRVEHLETLLKSELFSVPTNVIYRDPSSWSSTLWVNVGELDNEKLGRKVIAKNSPVLSEGSLVGIVEYVGEKQSQVRLLTDSGLCPAVRVSRGGAQNRELVHQIQLALNLLQPRDDLFGSIFEKEHHISCLKSLLKRVDCNWEDGYLAKGEVHGSSAPFWRSRSPILRGIGFNYEYPDDEGGREDFKNDIPILKEGDLLVTSGLDGVFPLGLKVGIVIRCDPLKKGRDSYEIDVKPMVSNFNELKTLFILPPIE